MFIEVTDYESSERILLNTAAVATFEIGMQTTYAHIAAPYRDEVREDGGDRIHLKESLGQIKELLREAGELA